MPIDFTEAELKRFSPKMSAVYLRGLLSGKDVLAEAGILERGPRFCHFMGQFGAETNGGTAVRENLTYTTVKAIRGAWRARASKHSDAWIKANLVRNPVALGDWAYGGRLGNKKGTRDGYDFRGGGYIQTTGKSNVERYCNMIGVPVRSDILDDPIATLKFACAAWKEGGCNELADANDLMGISKAINTGSATSNIMPNGMEHRQHWFDKARAIWWDAEPAEESTEPPLAQTPALASLGRTSRKVKVANAGETGLVAGGGILATVVMLMKDAAEFIKTYGFEIAVVAGFLGVVAFATIKHFTRQDHAEGRYLPSGESK